LVGIERARWGEWRIRGLDSIGNGGLAEKLATGPWCWWKETTYSNWWDHLGMEHEDSGLVFELKHSLCNIDGRYSWELFNTRLDQEALESTNAGLDEWNEILLIAWNNTAIESNINPALALSSLLLGLQVLEGGGRRNGIEWHINDCCNSS